MAEGEEAQVISEVDNNNNNNKRKLDDDIQLAKLKAQEYVARYINDAESKRPRLDDIQLAKLKAQELVARFVNDAESKRPRLDDSSEDPSSDSIPPFTDDDIQLAKLKAQEHVARYINDAKLKAQERVARYINDAESKRPRLDDSSEDPSSDSIPPFTDDDIQLAKLKAQEHVARFINDAESKRPRLDDSSEDPSSDSIPPFIQFSAPAAAATKPKKKAVASKPKKKETEYFEEKRNMEGLWKDVFPVGTEWDQLDAVYKYNWDFSNLENAFEEGGKLYGEKVYLFGSTEPQLVKALKGDDDGKEAVVCIPVVVAVVSPFPPSDKIGINSVQREAEEIIPMKEMKMDWVPYIPWENRDNQVERLKSPPQIFILSCTQRRASLRHMKIERIKKYEYCLPYFYQPDEEFEQTSTVVDIMYPAEPQPVICQFDWELDDLEEFVGQKVEDESITEEDQKDAFKEFIKEKVREAKKANREAREARKKAIEEMIAETKDALNKMRFYKFYPVESPDTPDISKVKSPFINRYYGKAHEVL